MAFILIATRDINYMNEYIGDSGKVKLILETKLLEYNSKVSLDQTKCTNDVLTQFNKPVYRRRKILYTKRLMG